MPSIVRFSKEGTDMSEQWLACKIFKGMFSDEMAVEYGNDSFFVPKNLVRPTEQDRGRVRLSVFNKGSTTCAVLPTDDSVIIS
jgi:hypothetical protein